MKNKPDTKKVQKELTEIKGNLEKIGEGGFKVVYKAHIGNLVEAVKLVLIPSEEDDELIREDNIQRLKREIKVLSQCKSPYLVKLGSIEPRECNIGGQTYIIYSEELLEGQDLQALIGSGQKIELSELLSLGKCLFSAIQELKSIQVIHRDIKPANIIRLDDDERPYVLLDLGIAFIIGGTRYTRDSAVVPGTLYYIAPEMLDVNFRQNLDYRADLYTVGLVLYEFSSGIQPFAKREDPYTTLYRIKTMRPDPLHTLRNDLPEDFCRLVDQLIKKRPAIRPANIDLLLEKLEDIR